MARLAVGLLGALAGWGCTGPRAGLTMEQYRERLEGGLAAVDAITARQERHPLRFGANLFFAHEGLIEHVPLDVLEKEIDAFHAMGLDRVDINMGLFPWRDRDEGIIAKYDAVVRRIRDAGMDLAINPQYSPVRHRISSLDAWTRASLPVYEQIARRYRPEILVTVHEPTTMNARMGVDAGPREWKEFAQAAARTVKRVSPTTRCGAGALASEAEYFMAFLGLSDLDVLSVDIYGLKGLKGLNRMIGMAHRAGKPVYIEETWRPPYTSPRARRRKSLETISATGIGLLAFQGLDAAWLRAMTGYASAWKLESITPFWTQTFFKYVSKRGDGLGREYNVEVMEAIRRGERTATYRAYQDLIREYGRKSHGEARRGAPRWDLP